MKNTQHTPTPWQYNTPASIEKLTRDNAALVEALEAIEEQCRYACEFYAHGEDAQANIKAAKHSLNFARAALTAAKAKEGGAACTE